MKTMESTEIRQRTLTLIQETGALLEMIPQILDRSEELKSQFEAVSRENEELSRGVAPLRAEVQQLRTDREEMSDSLTVIMNEIMRLTSNAIALLQPPERRGSFRREVAPPTDDDAPARAAAMATVLPWKRNR